MLRIREKAKIDPRRKRFALEKVDGQDYALIIDRDAEVEYAAESVVGGRYVARVVEPYARVVCDALNLINTDHNALLALRPAKRRKYALPLCQQRDPTNNAWWACSRPRGHQGACQFDRKAPKR